MPMCWTASISDVSQLSLGGFQRVSADRLAAFGDGGVIDLFRAGMLCAIQARLFSMSGYRDLLGLQSSVRQQARLDGSIAASFLYPSQL